MQGVRLDTSINLSAIAQVLMFLGMLLINWGRKDERDKELATKLAKLDEVDGLKQRVAVLEAVIDMHIGKRGRHGSD